MLESVRNSETSVCYNETTLRNVPEGSNRISVSMVSSSDIQTSEYAIIVNGHTDTALEEALLC
jgi:hypothetical protein